MAAGALRELAAFADAPGRHAAAITAQLQHRSRDVRSLAAFLLGRAGNDARNSVPALEVLLVTEANGPTRIRAAEALVRISPEHVPAMSVLLAGLSASERAIRWEAVCCWDAIRLAEPRQVALRRVIDRLQDVEPQIQVMAALKLGDAKPEQALAAGALEKVLQRADSSRELRHAAQVALAALNSHKPSSVRSASAVLKAPQR